MSDARSIAAVAVGRPARRHKGRRRLWLPTDVILMLDTSRARILVRHADR
jgi:hypothetical protein